MADHTDSNDDDNAPVSLVRARAYLAQNDNLLVRLSVLSAHLRGGDTIGDRDTAYTSIAVARAYGIKKLDKLLGERDTRSTGIAMSADRRFAVFVSYCNDGNIQLTFARRGKKTFFIEMVTDKFDEKSLHCFGAAQDRADIIASSWTPLWWPDSDATLLAIMNASIHALNPRPKMH